MDQPSVVVDQPVVERVAAFGHRWSRTGKG